MSASTRTMKSMKMRTPAMIAVKLRVIPPTSMARSLVSSRVDSGFGRRDSIVDEGTLPGWRLIGFVERAGDDDIGRGMGNNRQRNCERDEVEDQVSLGDARGDDHEHID